MKPSILLAAASAAVLMASCAYAQDAQPTMTATIQFQYQELIPNNGDAAAARSKIMAQLEKDCETAGKAFGRQCIINNVNFNENQNIQMGRWQANPPGTRVLFANASVSLKDKAERP
jgi:opacity protein-like surface antigen